MSSGFHPALNSILSDSTLRAFIMLNPHIPHGYVANVGYVEIPHPMFADVAFHIPMWRLLRMLKSHIAITWDVTCNTAMLEM